MCIRHRNELLHGQPALAISFIPMTALEEGDASAEWQQVGDCRLAAIIRLRRCLEKADIIHPTLELWYPHAHFPPLALPPPTISDR